VEEDAGVLQQAPAIAIRGASRWMPRWRGHADWVRTSSSTSRGLQPGEERRSAPAAIGQLDSTWRPERLQGAARIASRTVNRALEHTLGGWFGDVVAEPRTGADPVRTETRGQAAGNGPRSSPCRVAPEARRNGKRRGSVERPPFLSTTPDRWSRAPCPGGGAIAATVSAVTGKRESRGLRGARTCDERTQGRKRAECGSL
jgi:hypothetical protein